MTAVTHVSHTEDVLGEFGFRLVWQVDDYRACVEAYKIESIVMGDTDSDDEIQFEAASGKDQFTSDLSNSVKYLDGFVKWDGCTELDMGCPHWCSPLDYIKHGELLKHIYHRAFELMGRTPDEAWPA